MRAWTALESHLASRDVARVIYGAVVGLALVAALQDDPPSAGAVAAGLAATALSVGLAELYSEVVAAEARDRRPVQREQVHRYARGALAVVLGAGLPCGFFILAAVGWLSLDAAFAWAKWTGVTLIGGYGFLRRASRAPIRCGPSRTAGRSQLSASS